MTNDKLEILDKRLRELRKEVEDDLLKYGNHFMEIPEGLLERIRVIKEKAAENVDKEEMCSCGSRQKSKCVKESGYNTGKMCLRKMEEKLE